MRRTPLRVRAPVHTPTPRQTSSRITALKNNNATRLPQGFVFFGHDAAGTTTVGLGVPVGVRERPAPSLSPERGRQAYGAQGHVHGAKQGRYRTTQPRSRWALQWKCSPAWEPPTAGYDRVPLRAPPEKKKREKIAIAFHDYGTTVLYYDTLPWIFWFHFITKADPIHKQWHTKHVNTHTYLTGWPAEYK